MLQTLISDAIARQHRTTDTVVQMVIEVACVRTRSLALGILRAERRTPTFNGRCGSNGRCKHFKFRP